MLREDSSSRMGSFDKDLEGSSLSGHSEGDSCSGNAEELIKALEAKATRAPALPIGAGDALYNNLTQSDEGETRNPSSTLGHAVIDSHPLPIQNLENPRHEPCTLARPEAFCMLVPSVCLSQTDARSNHDSEHPTQNPDVS
jgi:hypothetical protein